MKLYSFEEILDRSPKEIAILNEIENLHDVYEHSEGYINFKQKIDDLYDALADERKSKATKIIQGVTRKRMSGNKQNIKHSDADKEKKNPSTEYLNCAEIFDRLSQHEKRLFFDAHCKIKRSEIEKLPHPKMKQEDINELHDLLVGICIDYLASKGFDDVDDISLSIDGLRGSIEAVEWIPETDSFLSVFGYGKNDNDDFPTKKLIGESY